MNLTITGYSTAMFSTWYFVEELDILFDAGDGISAGLLQKARKIEHAFISHADRDHLTGLHQFAQLNSREGGPKIYYPKDSGSFPALESFTKKFDSHVNGSIWVPLRDRDKVEVKSNRFVQAIRNNHVAIERGIHKSFGYKVVEVKHKLNEELLKLSPSEIKQAIETKGKAQTHTEINKLLLVYSGDTPCENFEEWKGAEVLIHEATFLGGDEDKHIQTHGNKHSRLDEVLDAVSQSGVQKLILGHFSSRYSAVTIDTKIKELCQLFKITIPVYRVLPGETGKNILNTTPVWQ